MEQTRIWHRPKHSPINGRIDIMPIRIEFFRLHNRSTARARLNRIYCVSPDLKDAITQAESLLKDTGMPQEPDAFALFDDQGNELYQARFTPTNPI